MRGYAGALCICAKEEDVNIAKQNVRKVNFMMIDFQPHPNPSPKGEGHALERLRIKNDTYLFVYYFFSIK